MAEYDLKTAIPEQKFTNIYSMWRPGVTDPGKLIVGDPYIRFEDQNKSYYTRNFNHSKLVPSKSAISIFNPKDFSYGWKWTHGNNFIMPLMQTLKEGTGKVIGYVKGQISTDIDTGKNILKISNLEISHGADSPRYGETFATGKKDQGLKTNIGRNILTQVIQKLPFIDQIEGHRVSGARDIAQEEAKKSQSFVGKLLKRPTKTVERGAVIKPEVISKIKNNLASKGLLDSFFAQAKLSTDNVKEWLTKNNRAVAGVALSGNDPMQSLGIKSMGSATDDPANFYLKMAEGGFIEGGEFSDMIEFVSSTMMHGGGMADINYLTRRL